MGATLRRKGRLVGAIPASAAFTSALGVDVDALTGQPYGLLITDPAPGGSCSVNDTLAGFARWAGVTL